MDRYEVHVPCGKEVVVICRKEGENVKLVQNGETIYEENNNNNSNNNNKNNKKYSPEPASPEVPDVNDDDVVQKTDTANEDLNSTEKSDMAGGKRSRRNGAARKNNVTKRKNQAGGKRGPNGYMKFANKIRPQILKEHPELKSDVVGVARKIGEKWRSLSDAEKKKY